MLTLVAVVCLAVWYALWWAREAWRTNPKSLPYPPGPPQKWVIGNLTDMPSPTNFQNLIDWKEQFGDMTFLQALGQSVLILNSLKAVTDLLEKRGLAYAHRPRLAVAGELMGLNEGIGLMEYNPRQRLMRRLAHRALGTDAIKRYEPMLQRHSLLLMKDLINKPDDFEAAIRLATARNILTLSYGIHITSSESQYVVDAEKTMSVIECSTEPGAYLADFLPILKYVPSWFPLASFKRFAEAGRKQIDDFNEHPFSFVKGEMKQGRAPPSLVRDMLTEEDPSLDKFEDEEKDRIIKLVFGGLYGAGSATTASTVTIFIMLMALNPEKQRIAQAEIDRITEGKRLPSFADRERLPYVCAMMKEVMRWHAVVPLGKQTRTADEYNGKSIVMHMYSVTLLLILSLLGYFIPKNTIVLPNIWAISKSDGTSTSNEDFSPERYFHGKEVVDPYDYVFGFGRRICPGRFLADNALFSIFASILACFTISKKRYGDGKLGQGFSSEIPITPEFTRHLVSYPLPFVCDIRPRSTEVHGLVNDTLASTDNLNECTVQSRKEEIV
ncbi:cytochrome P450 [Schizopora paradoxa]|uniref:Cytochrome P450 n=1 Tax=Schizopora paradoxa TaxID=27342 RepID=A0A0H2RUB4_9AGAM|nr:cytochrome P450 [Schizopora paradoxa]